MIESAFLVYCLLLYAGLGTWALMLIEYRGLLARAATVLVAGIATLGVLCTIGYMGGLTTGLIFLILNCCGVAGFVTLAVKARKEYHRLSLRELSPLFIAGLATAALMILPAQRGGLQFTLSQANHYDNFNYLESAITHLHLPYTYVRNASLHDLINAGGFPIAQTNLNTRPTIAIVYGVLAHFSPVHFLGLHYVFLSSMLFAATAGLAALIRTMQCNVGDVAAWLVATGVTSGFWGQYILDIDAWSQIAWFSFTPFYLFPILFHDDKEKSGLSWRTWFAWSLILLGGFYFYPEGSAFYFLSLVCTASILLAKRYPWQQATKIIGACLLSAILIAPVYTSNVRFLLQQLGSGNSAVDWWQYFEMYVGGNDGFSNGLIATIVDGLAAAAGMYFLTPAATSGPAVAVIIRILLGLVFLAFGYLALRGLLQHSRINRLTSVCVIVFFVILLLQNANFLWRGLYWTSGKFLSFWAPIALGSLFALTLSTRGLWFTRRTALALVIALTLGGWLFGIQRVLIADRPFGIQHAAPYPPNSPNDTFKTTFNYTDLSFLQSISGGDIVGIDIESPWIESYARMQLIAREIPFTLLTVVHIGRYPYERVTMPSSHPATVKLTVATDFGKKLPSFIKSERISDR